MVGYTNPQIWFQDVSCSWFFIADTFTAYFRLMMVTSPRRFRILYSLLLALLADVLITAENVPNWPVHNRYTVSQMHLGVPRWHYAFTRVGPDPVAQVC